MSALSNIANLLNVQPGEGRPISRLSGLYFILVMAFIFLQATTFGLFIAEFGSKSLPFAYLSISVLASLVAYLYLRLSKMIPLSRLLYINLGFLAIMCTVFRLGLATPLRRSFIFLLPFWFQTLINLVNLVIWPLAGRIFDLRQAKRLFTLILSGSWSANVLGGFIIAPLVGRIGTDNLLFFSVVIIIAALFLLRTILHEYLDETDFEPTQSRAMAPSRSKTTVSPFKHPYIRLIFAYFLLYWLCFYFVDNIFYDRAGAQFPDAVQLAGFIGQLIAVTGIIGLISSTFLASRIIGRYGLRMGLLIMPFFVIADIAVVALVGTIFPDSPILFWLVSAAKMLILALGFSISQSASTLLYQPLPSNQRGSTQAMAEGIVQPLAIGLAGLSLLLFNTILGMGAVQLSYIFLVLGVGWITAILLLGRQYPKTLSHALAKREWGQSTTQLLDPACRDLLLENMQNPHAGVVIYSLNMLEQSNLSSWNKTLARQLNTLLSHPAPEVRQDVLGRVENLGLRAAVGIVRQHLETETVPEVKAAALQALASIGETDSFEPLVSYMDDPDPSVQRGALVGLLRYSGIDGVLAAGKVFNDLVQSPDPVQRIRASNVLAEVGLTHFYQPALLLLRDKNPEVQRAALNAAAKIRNPHLWKAVVEASGTPETNSAAELALAAGGEDVLSEIETVVSDISFDAEHPLAGRTRIQLISLIRACGRISGQRSIKLLLTQIGALDNQVRTQVFESLSACEFHTSATDVSITDSIRPEIDLAVWLTAIVHDFTSTGDAESARLLIDALETAIQETRDRILLLLSFLYDSKAILRAKETFQSNTSQQAYALEVIDTQLPGAYKTLVIPLLEDILAEERLVRWDSISIRPQHQSRDADLEALITGLTVFTDSPGESTPEKFQFSPWMRACALITIGAQSITNKEDIVRSSQSSPEPLVCEASLWALDRLRTPDIQGEVQMLSTFEKVIILKTASIFSHVTDEILADVATLMEEINLSENETVFAKGDHGDRLYIVVSGKLGAFDGERLLNYLEKGDVFGEMALLDPAPRLASITVLEPTRLLYIEQQPFRQLLTDRPEVATGVITVLTRRLRDRVHDLNQVSLGNR